MDQVSGGVGVHRGLQGDDGPSEWGHGGISRPSVLSVYAIFPQGVLEGFDDIVMAVGSGGTLCGVTIANYLTGSKVK